MAHATFVKNPVSNQLFITGGSYNKTTDMPEIKKAIMEYGAVTTRIEVADEFYNLGYDPKTYNVRYGDLFQR